MKSKIVSLLLTSVAAYSADALRSPGSVQVGPRSAASVVKELSAPVLGLFTNAERNEVRAIVGVPGASLVSDPIVLPDGIGRIFLAPGQHWGVAEIANGSGLAIVFFDGAMPGRVFDVPRSLSQVDVMAFSPSGSAVILYSRASAKIETILVSGQIVSNVVDYSEVDLDVSLLAIDDSASAPAVVTNDGSAYLLTREGAPQLVLRGGALAAATYLPRSATLLIVDSSSGLLTAVDEILKSRSVRVLTPLMPEGTNLLQASLDARYLFVSTSGTRRAVRIDLAELELVSLDLPVDAASMQRMRNGNTFLFSAGAADPAWMLLGEESTLRAVFAARPVAEVTEEPQCNGALNICGKQPAGLKARPACRCSEYTLGREFGS